MKQIDMVKAFAELEGVELFSFDDGKFCALLDSESEVAFYRVSHNVSYKVYNPITDLALTMKAVIDYKVSISHPFSGHQGCVQIPAQCGGYALVKFIENLPLAIIECILKSAGKWHDS